MNILTAPREFRLRARWMKETLNEADAVSVAEKSKPGDETGKMEMLAVALIDLGNSFAAAWGRFLLVLEYAGCPGGILRDTLNEVRLIIDGMERQLPTLQEHVVTRRHELVGLAQMIDSVKRTVAAIEPTVIPAIDPELLNWREHDEPVQEQSERIEDVLARVTAGGAI